MPPAAKAAPKQALHILVVDDNLDQVHSLAFLLSHAGHAVDYAVNATVAMDLAERLQPDVIVLDVALPDGSGLSLAGELRRMPGLEKTYLIAITGTEVAAEEALAAGFDKFLRKPVSYSTLEEILAALLADE